MMKIHREKFVELKKRRHVWREGDNKYDARLNVKSFFKSFSLASCKLLNFRRHLASFLRWALSCFSLSKDEEYWSGKLKIAEVHRITKLGKDFHNLWDVFVEQSIFLMGQQSGKVHCYVNQERARGNCWKILITRRLLWKRREEKFSNKSEDTSVTQHPDVPTSFMHTSSP